MYAARCRCSIAFPPHACELSSVMRGRKRFPPAESIRLTASVMSGLSVVNDARKKRSMSACIAGSSSRTASSIDIG